MGTYLTFEELADLKRMGIRVWRCRCVEHRRVATGFAARHSDEMASGDGFIVKMRMSASGEYPLLIDPQQNSNSVCPRSRAGETVVETIIR